MKKFEAYVMTIRDYILTKTIYAENEKEAYKTIYAYLIDNDKIRPNLFIKIYIEEV